MDDRAWIIGGQSIRHVDPKRRRGNEHFARHLVCEKFTTGWSGAWRAAVEGKPGELAGSWTADLPPARDARFTELFEAGARDAVRGVWNAGGNSGSWSIRAVK